MKKLRALLILEDSPLFNDFSGALTGSAEIETHVAGGEEEALALACGGSFDVVVSGLHISEQASGLRLLRAVRDSDSLLPFFFFTSESSPQQIAQAFQEGAHDYFIADGSAKQISNLIEAIKVNVELATLLRARQGARLRSDFAEKYAGLFEELEEGSLMVSADSGLITYVNESLAASLGFDVTEIIGTAIEDFQHAGANGVKLGLDDLAWEIENGAGVIEMTFRHQTGSLRTYWTSARLLELSGQRVILCQCRDITRFEQLEREVIAVRNQLRTIVENSADAIIVSREDRVIEFLGGAAPQLFGVSPDDDRIHSLDDLFGGQSEEVERMLDHLGSRPRVSGIETSIVSRWGTRVPVSVSITVLPSSDGITRFLFNILDITAQKVGEAEKMLAAELVRIVGGEADPVEALPKLVERVRSAVPIDFGLLLGADAQRESLSVVAVYSEESAGSLRVGQGLGLEYLPVEEELWRREGIIRNNLQKGNLTPLEQMLFEQGVRSFVSVPLTEGDSLIGAAHFGSVNSYALNRGHLALFRELASAFAGALVKAMRSGDAFRYRLFTAALAEEVQVPIVLTDAEGTVLQINPEAGKLFEADWEPRGRPVERLLRSIFPALMADKQWLRKQHGGQRPVTARDGARWIVAVRQVGEQDKPAGYVVTLKTT